MNKKRVMRCDQASASAPALCGLENTSHRERHVPVGAGFPLLHPLLLPPPLPPAPLLSLPGVVTVHRAVRHTVRPAAPVTNPREVLLPGNGPGFEILLVLGDAGERHPGRVVVLPGLVTGLLPRPEGPSAGRRAIRGRMRGAGGGALLRDGVVVPGRALRRRDLFGDGPHLMLGDVRVVLDGERDGEVRFVELVPEASQAAHSADARPSHPLLSGKLFDLWMRRRRRRRRRRKEEKK